MPFHDQLFKDLLRTFFADFLTLVVPGLAAELCLDRISVKSFLDAELFTDMPRGERRLVDLLVQIPAKGGEEDRFVLVHVEIEARSKRIMDQRMRSYSFQIESRHHLPILPIVINLRGGDKAIEKRDVPIMVLSEQMGSFSYFIFSLERSQAEDYVERPEPLAWALASLMKSDLRPAEHKLACMRPIAHDPALDEARRFLLANCVETYVELEDEEASVYDALVAKDGAEEVATMQMTWADKIAARAREAALLEGIEQGERRGRREGIRRTLIRQLRRRFGRVPATVRRRLEAIDSIAELERLADRILVAKSLDDLGLR